MANTWHVTSFVFLWGDFSAPAFDPRGGGDDPISWWMCGVRGVGADIVLRCHAMATTAGPLYTL